MAARFCDPEISLWSDAGWDAMNDERAGGGIIHDGRIVHDTGYHIMPGRSEECERSIVIPFPIHELVYIEYM
jgi:hypothetical protein